MTPQVAAIIKWKDMVKLCCSFCGRTTKLLAEGPDVNICDACVTTAMQSVPSDARAVCRFCRKEGVIILAVLDDVRICSQCVGFARSIIDHQRSGEGGVECVFL